jgi:hypothetical protein
MCGLFLNVLDTSGPAQASVEIALPAHLVVNTTKVPEVLLRDTRTPRDIIAIFEVFVLP